MGIHNLEELREVADVELKNLPDDALICEYSKDSGIPANEAARFFKPELVPLDCKKVLYWHQVESYQIPKGFLSSSLIAMGLFLAGYRIWKKISGRAAGESALNAGIRWSAFGVFLVFGMSISFTINGPLLSALTSFLILMVIVPSSLFAIGFLFKSIKNKARNLASPNRVPTNAQPSNSRNSEEIWKIIAEEMEGEIQNKALWAKSFSEANGNEENAKAIYMKSRYDQLASNQ